MMTETVVNVQDAPNSNNAANKQGERRHPLDWIKMNSRYFLTLPGLIKVAQMILGILCMALASAYWVGATHFFIFVATVSFIGTLIWVFIYFLGVREATANFPINWILTELLNTGICTGAYLIAFIVQLAVWGGSIYPEKGRNIAAGVFGLLNTMAYGFGTYLLYVESKNNRT